MRSRPAAPVSGFWGSARSRQGFARCARRTAALTRPSALPPEASIEAAGILGEGRDTMLRTLPTPSITVAIGRHTRVYSAFVTTAPVDLDAPATVTLHAARALGGRRIRRRPRHARPDARTTSRPGSSSSTRPSSPGSRRGIARVSTPCCRPTPDSSASTPCSTGCGNACRAQRRRRRTHEHQSAVAIVRHSKISVFLEVTL